MSEIFLPLRSNGAWFTTVQTRRALERRMKMHLLLYDTMIVQDGRYVCVCGESTGFEVLLPAASCSTDRTKIEYYEPGGEFGVVLGEKQLVKGTSDVSYEVDFYPILHDAGLLSADYVRRAPIDLPNGLTSQAQHQVTEDMRDEGLRNTLPGGRYQQTRVLEGLYIDSMLAREMRLPFGADHNVAPVIKWNHEQAKQRWRSEAPPAFFDCWIGIGLPDFSSASWAEVCDLRESAAGRDFRRMIEKLTCVVEEELPNLTSERDVAELVQGEFTKELVHELLQRRTTTSDTTLNLALNFLPCGTLLGILKEIKSLGNEKASWVSLLEPPRQTSAEDPV